MKTYRYVFASTAMALLVSGCGGGGSSASNDSGPTIPTAAVQITTQNSAAVAKGGASSAAGMAQTGSGNATAIGVVVVSGSHRSVRDIALSEFNRALSLPLPKQTVVGVVSTSAFTSNCTTGAPAIAGAPNTVTYTFTAAGATLSAGDSMTISYTSCTQGGFTTDGSLKFVIASLTGTRPGTSVAPFSAGFTMTFTNLIDRTVASGDTSSINGDITIATTSNGTTVSDTISGSGLTISSTIGGVTNYAAIMGIGNPAQYSINYTETIAFPNAYNYSVNMKVASTDMNGSVTISTSPPFSAPSATSNPTAGVMTIAGANGGSIQLAPNADGLTVQMTVIPSGSPAGTPGTITTVPWTQL